MGGTPTKVLCKALSESLIQMLPIRDYTLFAPSMRLSAISPSDEIRYFDPLQKAFYYWNMNSKTVRWAHGPELLPISKGMLVLNIVADLGSTGWSLFQMFVLLYFLRAFFHPDPLHRLSCLFVNAVKAVPAIFRTVMDVQLVFKWKRAPYGGGRFFREAQEQRL